ncbi:MAG: MoaD/ThiS family protein [Candidatus Hermodarchaeota archaeon]
MVENNKILVTVKLFADFRKFGPDKSNIEFTKGSSITTILENYNIPTEKTKMIILVNGKPIYDRQSVLNDGDTVALFPPLAGG